MSPRAERITAFVYPAAGVLALLALWQLLAVTGWVPGYLLPAPLKVARSIARSVADGTLALHLAPTLTATVVGYVAGSAVAVLMAALVAEFKWVERALLLHLVALQSIPKVSIAPLVFLWLGFGLSGKMLLVALICFFPVFAGALAGFRAADPDLVDLMRAAGASRLHIWRHVKLPGALSHLFAGLEVSVAFALIGCVVMEFIGSTRGIGFLIQDASNTFDLALSFAAVIVLGLVGLAGNLLVRLARARLLFWEHGRTGGDAGAGRA
jgi:NitT/TauT family transport system permease protein